MKKLTLKEALGLRESYAGDDFNAAISDVIDQIGSPESVKNAEEAFMSAGASQQQASSFGQLVLRLENLHSEAMHAPDPNVEDMWEETAGELASLVAEVTGDASWSLMDARVYFPG